MRDPTEEKCGASGSPAAPRISRWLPLLALALALAGCSHPIGAHRIPPREFYAGSSATVLSGNLSANSLAILRRHGLDRDFNQDPEKALTALQQIAKREGRRDVMFVIAEASCLHAQRFSRRGIRPDDHRARDLHLTAAIFSYWYLFADAPGAMPSPFAPEFRLACDIYNFSAARAVLLADGQSLATDAEQERHLPGGRVQLQAMPDPSRLSSVAALVPADELRIHGLRIRNRGRGLGSPLVAEISTNSQPGFWNHTALTLLLRPRGNLQEWTNQPLVVSFELLDASAPTGLFAYGTPVPLETDTTAPLAYALNDAAAWKLGFSQFFSIEERLPTGIHLMEPYDATKIPVVFVHGTLSSPVWWAEMWNSLQADDLVRRKFQFWTFAYNSGKPLPVSAELLRRAIEEKVTALDPLGTNLPIRQMIVAGHSQGGLLAKLTAVDPGDRLWDAVSDKALDDLPLEEEIRNAMKRHFHYRPLPSVKRVVFIATPHRGSFLAGGAVRGILRRFMNLPFEVLGAPSRLKRIYEAMQLPQEMRRVPSSVDGMSPRNPWLMALADTPVSTGIKAHSIIAIKGTARPPAGSDGVVKYTSAHHPGVESELVIRSGHTCQNDPQTIQELVRILHLHAAHQGFRASHP